MSSSDPFFDKTLHPKPWASMVMPIHSCRNTILKSLDGLDRQQVPWWCEVIFILDTIKDDTLETHS